MGFIDESMRLGASHGAFLDRMSRARAEGEALAYAKQVGQLREELEELARDRDRWRERAQGMEYTVEELRAHIEALQEEIERLRLEKDWDACVIKALAAQRNALRNEMLACPNHEAHPLRDEDARRRIYREAYKAEWRRREIPGDPDEAFD